MTCSTNWKANTIRQKDLIDEKQKWGRTRNAFLNFDRVAAGQKNTQVHDGPPWYDGLVYETIRGAADLLIEYPDANLEKKIDGYIDRIAATQAADPDGYINTYTTLMMPGKRWGTNGGDDKWQHDIYNSGMLVDAAVHYYNQPKNKTVGCCCEVEQLYVPGNWPFAKEKQDSRSRWSGRGHGKTLLAFQTRA